ncbi:unnamed protein product, partial [marine sediment metagenome]
MMSVKTLKSRIPWSEYISGQLIKILGLGLLTLILVINMVLSAGLDLELLSTPDFSNIDYLIVIILSSVAFIFVLIGFTKIVLFDMAEEFGLRDDAGNMVYNFRFWLFTILDLSFCSSIYLLLDVLIKETFLVILPVLLMRNVLESFDLDFVNFSALEGREFYQTTRNLYFGFFFVIIIGFSIIVFLVVLTTFARRRIVKRFRKEEEEEIEKQGIRTIYKLFLWILIPPFIYSAINMQSSRANETVGIIMLIISTVAFVWWVYQVFKIIFLTVWRGVK